MNYIVTNHLSKIKIITTIDCKCTKYVYYYNCTILPIFLTLDVSCLSVHTKGFQFGFWLGNIMLEFIMVLVTALIRSAN